MGCQFGWLSTDPQVLDGMRRAHAARNRYIAESVATLARSVARKLKAPYHRTASAQGV